MESNMKPRMRKKDVEDCSDWFSFGSSVVGLGFMKRERERGIYGFP
ncbi:uncharacterized protein G2W53_029770 [Senna tora]|uniref:Uncharacterized protein n=1 Tax=Senna tora TaxID=362788 RepID=A0A834T6A8_9FABA|nr:uncharacterized protein G2W53_029770 [Senna tora]